MYFTRDRWGLKFNSKSIKTLMNRFKIIIIKVKRRKINWKFCLYKNEPWENDLDYQKCQIWVDDDSRAFKLIKWLSF